MKFDVVRMAGEEAISGRRFVAVRWAAVPFLLLVVAATDVVVAQTLYKYRGPDGEWIFSDRQPENNNVDTEQRTLVQRSKRANLSVTNALVGNNVELTAHNEFYAPMEVAVSFGELAGIQHPGPEAKLRWVVPANSDRVLIRLPILDSTGAAQIEFKYSYLPGDPGASHQPDRAYRVPFSVGKNYPISQAYPDSMTHQAPDSRHAVDIAMPIGTDVFAARGGVVFDVASKNYRAGLDPHREGQAANIIFILHDDGTFAIYAHLNWNSIRVNPGDRVQTGEYIADSGNTGFSSGPHLHFAIQKNAGFEITSLPVEFKGANSSRVEPMTGQMLMAYP